MSALQKLTLAALVLAGCQGEIGVPRTMLVAEGADASVVVPGADASTLGLAVTRDRLDEAMDLLGAIVTRPQMAVSLLRAVHGKDHAPPASGSVFSDVPADHWARNWIAHWNWRRRSPNRRRLLCRR